MTETTTLPNPPASGTLSGAQIARAAGVVVAGFVLARLLGLVQDIILADIYRLTGLFDAFQVASRPPETIFYVVAGGALGSAFIPEFVGYFVRGEDKKAWRMASSVVNAFLLVMAALCALAAIFAPQLIHAVLAPTYPPEKVALTAHLMRIMLVTPFIFTASGLLMGILNARQHFLLPALAPSVYNLGIIFGALVLAPSMGIEGVAWGTVIGAVLHLVIQLPGLVALKPQYRLSIDLKDPGFWRVLRLMGPRVLALAIVQINFWVEIILATSMVEGSVSALRRGFMLMLMPQGVIAQSVAIAVFPTFAAQVAAGDHGNLRRTYSQVLRTVLFLSLPATIGLILLRLPIIRVIYEHGNFTLTDSQAVSWALLFYGLGLVSHSLLEIVTRAFFALHDTRTPVIISGGAMLLNVFFCLALSQMIGSPGSLVMGPFGGLALALTLSTTLEVIALMILLRPRIAEDGEMRDSLRHDLASISRMLAASAVMGVGLWFVVPLLPAGSGLMLALATGAAILAAGAAYWGVAWALGSEEARMLTGQVMARIGRRRAAAGAGE